MRPPFMPCRAGLGTPHRFVAFTLIELLVVIGTIALLLAILLPVISKSRRAAEEVKCAGNLRQIGIALTTYISETGYYPGCQHFAGFGDDRTFAVWPTRLRNAMQVGASVGSDGMHKVFRCPSNVFANDWKFETGLGSPFATDSDQGYGYQPGERLLQVDHIAFSYAYNDWGAGPNGAGDAEQTGLGGDITYPLQKNGYGHELKASRVRRSSEMIAVSDSTSNGGGFNYNIDPREAPQYPGSVHRGGANVMFCDTHIQWFSQADLINVDPSTPAGAAMNRLWNNDNEVHLRN